MPDNLLIIGGTGFIGKSLCLIALRNGYKVAVLSLNSHSLENKISNVEYLQADITSLEGLKEKLSNSKFEYIVNLSGYIDHRNFSDGGNQIIDVHFHGVQNILLSLNLKYLKRFVQIGSSDEYGNSPSPQSEDMHALPISPYSLAKGASTQLMQMIYRTEDIPTVTLRLFLVYGPGQSMDRFLPQVINGCLSSKDFPVSSGEQLRDLCYIDDVIKAILMTFKNDKVNGKVFNIASGKPIRIRQVVELIQNKIGNGKAEFGKIPYRNGENMELYADISKVSEILKWQPSVSIEDGINRTIDYYQRKK